MNHDIPLPAHDPTHPRAPRSSSRTWKSRRTHEVHRSPTFEVSDEVFVRSFLPARAERPTKL